MAKIYFTTEKYTGNQTALVTRWSKDKSSRETGTMKVRGGGDTWNLKVNCELNQLTNEIGIDRSRAAERRARR